MIGCMAETYRAFYGKSEEQRKAESNRTMKAAAFVSKMVRKYEADPEWVWEMMEENFGCFQGGGYIIDEWQMERAEIKMEEKYGEHPAKNAKQCAIFEVWGYLLSEELLEVGCVYDYTAMVTEIPAKVNTRAVMDMYEHVLHCVYPTRRYGCCDLDTKICGFGFDCESYEVEEKYHISDYITYAELKKMYAEKKKAAK